MSGFAEEVRCQTSAGPGFCTGVVAVSHSRISLASTSRRSVVAPVSGPVGGTTSRPPVSSDHRAFFRRWPPTSRDGAWGQQSFRRWTLGVAGRVRLIGQEAGGVVGGSLSDFRSETELGLLAARTWARRPHGRGSFPRRDPWMESTIAPRREPVLDRRLLAFFGVDTCRAIPLRTGCGPRETKRPCRCLRKAVEVSRNRNVSWGRLS